MNPRKNQNSIFVLATLGVYLGLMLAGATPQVLSQAAMARQFDIKDEIEVSDDLDTKPDSEEIEAFFASNFETALTALVADLKELNRLGKYKKSGADTFSISAVQRVCSKAGRSGDSSFGPASRGSEWIESAYLSLQQKLQRSGSGEFPSFIEFAPASTDGDRCRTFGTDTELDVSDILVRVSFSRADEQSASRFAADLNALFAKRSAVQPDVLTKQLYDFTKASSANDQTLVLTRLPRAGLDTLLSSVAK